MPRPSFAYLFERFPAFTQTFCVREAEELRRQGLNPLIYSLRKPEDEVEQDVPENLRDAVIYLPDQKEIRAEVKRLKDEKVTPHEAGKTLRTWDHETDKQRVYEAAWLGLRLRKAGVRHVHSHFAGMATRTAYWLRQFYNITYSFTTHANDYLVREDLPIDLEDLIAEARFVINVSDFGTEDLRDRFPEYEDKILRVYNGLKTRDYPLSRLARGEQPPAPPRIIGVGRLIEKKGFADLISACAVLAEQGVEFECQIAGEGPLRQELVQQIEDNALEECVHLLGNKPQHEVIALLRDATIFALPCVEEKSGGMDNLPTVITEAMACGLPVVSTPIAGVPEQVIDAQTGRLTAPNDPRALAAALRELLDDPQRCRTLGRNGRNRAETVFDAAVTGARLKRLLCFKGRAVANWAAIRQDPKLVLRAI